MIRDSIYEFGELQLFQEYGGEEYYIFFSKEIGCVIGLVVEK